MPDNYTNSFSRFFEKVSEQARLLVIEAEKRYSAVPAQQKVVDAKKTAFATELSEKAARDLTAALAELEQKIALVAAIDDMGGPKQARVRVLNTPEVFDHFVSGFSEKISALEKFIPTARKRLAERRGILGEAGVGWAEAEWDLGVRGWREYAESVTQNIAAAQIAKSYCQKFGAGYGVRTFEDLLGTLSAPLPQAPTIAATVAA